ncbi:LLM class flavin-dependent oxidoreductase [Pseudogemmatithrix spongiicola]|uniref:LLM class flavin-dependent oxidoreductase n=1 Tax=Pseudogemmatithrix spongiicola TaxID=3062599 RepID=A0AA49JWY7_9BACT|nr:LLM class flavin-dependent oxidoreductase [Gemmatimonadaceae bacterium 'strain 138']WKW16321.1 LLM class flavin-dependent oxidoreductase [Gemmatimonadaceae bacterium 'strain 318']
MELGLYTFVEHTPDRHGTLIPREQRIANLLEEAVLADQVGLDAFGIGEHHREDYLASAPTILLAAIAARTSRIKLSTAVTVLSSEEPVRVFQQFATLDLLSQGRAEIMAGRGSFIESFPLFGYDLNDYDTLFNEKLDLLLELVRNERVTWKGRHRAPLTDQVVYPRPLQEQLPVWIAVGGTPQSVIRAAMHGVPMALAIIGGSPERFVPYAELYRDTWQKAGHDPAKLQLSINSHGFIGDTTAQAAEIAWHPYMLQMGKIGRERGWPPPTKHQFDAERSPKGAVLIGDPQAVIDKILWEHELFGMTRFTLQMSVGSLPHKDLMRAIELYGTVVAPAVRKAVGSGVATAV